MWNIILNVEKLNTFVDIYYYVQKLSNYCGGKLIYLQYFFSRVSEWEIEWVSVRVSEGLLSIDM